MEEYKKRIIQMYGISVCLLAAAVPVAEAGKQLAIVLILISGLLYFIPGKIRIPRNVVDISLLGFFITILISALMSGSFYTSKGLPYYFDRELHAIYAVLRIVLVFLIVRYMPLEDKLKSRVLFLLILSYSIALLWGEYNLISSSKRYLEIKGIGHVNHSSIFSGMLSFVSLNLAFSYRGKTRYLYMLVFLASFFAVVQSGSRASMLAFGGTFICRLLWNEKKHIKKFIYVSIPISLVGIGTTMMVERTLRKLKEGFHDPERLFIWRVSIEEWMKNNIFVGIGPNNSHYVNPGNYAADAPVQWLHLGHSHNTFLTTLLETGLIGLGFYLLFTGSIIFCLLRKKKKGLFTLSGLDIAIFNLINSFANTTFESSNALIMMFFWALALGENNEA